MKIKCTLEIKKGFTVRYKESIRYKNIDFEKFSIEQVASDGLKRIKRKFRRKILFKSHKMLLKRG